MAKLLQKKNAGILIVLLIASLAVTSGAVFVSWWQRHLSVSITVKGIEALVIAPGLSHFNDYKNKGPETTVLTPYDGGYGVVISLLNENLQDLGELYIKITYNATINGQPLEEGVLNVTVDGEYAFYYYDTNSGDQEVIRHEGDFNPPASCPALYVNGTAVEIDRTQMDWEDPPHTGMACETGSALELLFRFVQLKPITGATPNDTIDITVTIELGTSG
ncbi:MAG: hypothetical protein ACTSVF_03255 [Candidatus Asgardarchaeia archaeon]